jgi:hypothetical protein
MKKLLIILLICIISSIIFITGCTAGDEAKVISEAKKHTVDIATYPNSIKFLDKTKVRKISSEPNTYVVILYFESKANEYGDIAKEFIAYLMIEEQKEKWRYYPLEGPYQGIEIPSKTNDLLIKYVQDIEQNNIKDFKEIYAPTVIMSLKDGTTKLVSKEKRIALWERLGQIWKQEGFSFCEIVDIHKIKDNQYELLVCYVPNDSKEPYIVLDSIRLALVENQNSIQVFGEIYSDRWEPILAKCNWKKIIEVDPLTIEDFKLDYKGLKPGLSIDELTKLLGEPKQRTSVSNFLEVYSYQQVDVSVNLNDYFEGSEVYAYHITKKGVKTFRGIGISDHELDVMSRYGERGQEDGWLKYSLKAEPDERGNRFTYYYEFLIENGRVKEIKCGRAIVF